MPYKVTPAPSLSVIELLIEYAADPNNPELERQAKAIIADHFDNPALAFQIAELAMTRDQLQEVPKLLRFQAEIEAELFSEKRRARATTNELTNLWKAIGDKLAARIELAKDAGVYAEKPRIEARQADTASAGAEQFNPREREQLRRVTSMLTNEIRLISSNPTIEPRRTAKK